MNRALTQQPPETAASSGDGLPMFRPLAVTAFAANAPLLAWLLLAGRLGTALSVLAGLGIGLAVYGSLHLFIGRGLEPFFAGIRGQAKPADGAKALFVALLPVKYLVLGGLMFLLVRGGHLSIAWFTVGFLITQVSVTVATVLHLARQRRP